MNDTKDLIFKSMREASEYFGFPYSRKSPEINNRHLSCYCDWERISTKFIKVNEIFDTPKEFEVLCSKEYKYNVGDIIYSANSSFKVLKQIRIYREKMSKGKKEIVNEKGYLVKCVKDGYEFEVLETAFLRNYGCPVCSNHRTVKGINDVATTRPDIAILFENIEDAYTTTTSTKKKFRFKCPRCGGIKIDCTNNITANGFSCPHCSDGVSYPNKFMAKLLTELEIDYDREVRFDWCRYPCFVDETKLDYGSYDFVIPEMNLIIEMDGTLGHGKNVMTKIRHSRRKITVEETLYRDSMKDKLATENGYNIIRVNCDYHNIENRFDVVTNAVKNSLSSVFDLTNVNFKEIDVFCISNSYVIDIINLWNKGFSTCQIEKEMKLSQNTIGKYLRIGKKLGLCEYNEKESRNRGCKISDKRSPYLVLYNTKKEVFCSFTDMKDYYTEHYSLDLPRTSITRSVGNKVDYLGRAFTKITKEEFNKYYNNKSLADVVIGEAFLIAQK